MNCGFIVTEKNVRTADRIVEVLIEENCTVLETESILSEVIRGIKYSSAVQKVQKVNYREMFKGELEQKELH